MDGYEKNLVSFGLGRTYILFWSKLSLSSIIFRYEFHERFSLVGSGSQWSGGSMTDCSFYRAAWNASAD